MKYDLISVGSATIDVFAKTHSELIKIKTEKTEESLICYPSGEKILMTDLKFMTGGSGTNTSASFRKLGLKTAYLGNLGDDINGKKILRSLKKLKIDFIGTIGKEKTNYSFIMDSIEHDRTILAYKDASDKLKWSKINKTKLKTEWFYLGSLLNESYKTAEKLASYAKKNKIKIAFNPSNYQAKKGCKVLKNLLSKVDLLILNREEASLLSGQSKNNVSLLLKSLLKCGPTIVVVTDGKNGAWATEGKYEYFIKTRKVKVAEATGAGDCFASSLLTGLIKKNDLEFALKLGLINSESCIQKYGAKNGLLSWNEALKQIKKYKPKVTKKKL